MDITPEREKFRRENAHLTNNINGQVKREKKESQFEDIDQFCSSLGDLNVPEFNEIITVKDIYC